MKNYDRFILEAISADRNETIEILIELEKSNKPLFNKIIKKNQRIIFNILNSKDTKHLNIFDTYINFDQKSIFKCTTKNCLRYVLKNIKTINEEKEGRIIEFILYSNFYDKEIITDLIKKGAGIPSDLLYRINYNINKLNFFESLGYVLTSEKANKILDSVYEYSRNQIKMFKYLSDKKLITKKGNIHIFFDKWKFKQVIEYINVFTTHMNIRLSQLTNNNYSTKDNNILIDLILDKTDRLSFYQELALFLNEKKYKSSSFI
jgi:hypothetical protein